MNFRSFYRYVFLVLLSVFVFTGCGSDSEGGEFSYVAPTQNEVEKNKVIVSKVNGNTASYNSIATFNIMLDEAPSANVMIPIASSDETEGVVNREKLEFTPSNWSRSQTVVVKGRNHKVVEGKQNYKIILGTTESSDKTYDGVDPDDVSMKGIYLKLNDVTDSTKFIAGLDSTIAMNIDYTGFNDLNYTLVKKPDGMTIDENSGIISWKPLESDEGKNFDVEVKVSDGSLFSNVDFNISVANATLIKSELKGNQVTITEEGNLHGLVVTKVADETNIEDIEFKKISDDATREIPSYVTKITDTFIIDKEIDGTLIIKLPLSSLPSGTDLHYVHIYSLTNTLHEETAFWSPALIDKDISNVDGEPIIEITLTGLHGVYFIGIEDQEEIETSSSQKINNKILSKTDLSKITCTPIKNDYMKQECTYTDNEEFKVTVHNFGLKKESTHWNGTTIEEMIGWLIDAQEGFDNLNLSYDNDFSVSIERLKNSSWFGYVTTGNNEKRKNLHLTNTKKSKELMKATSIHEYFHHAQSRTRIDSRDSLIDQDDNGTWMIEGTAAWFMDYQHDGDNIYRDTILGKKILEDGLCSTTNDYPNSYFFKLINSKCNGKVKFTEMLKELLNIDKDNDPTGIKNLSTELENASCDFGNQLGELKKSSLESALLYYEYATLYENKISLLDSNEEDDEFEFEETPYKYEQSDSFEVEGVKSTGDLSVSSINNIPAYGAYSIKVEGDDWVNDLDEGYEQVLRVRTKKDNKPLTISIISDDNGFAGNSKIDGEEHFYYRTNEKIEHVFKEDELTDYFITILNPNNKKVFLDELVFEVRKKDSGKNYDLIAKIEKPSQYIFTEGTDITFTAFSSINATSYKWTKNGETLYEGESFIKQDFSIGKHNIKLTVSNQNGIEKTDSITITVIKPLIATFTSPSNVSDGEEIKFDASASQSAVSYEWKEGEKVLSTDASFSHTFSVGKHTILLTVTDLNGNTRSYEREIEVKEILKLLAPEYLNVTSTADYITLRWDKVEDASKYIICQSEIPIKEPSKCEENGGTLLSGGTSTETTITDNLNADTTYYFRVRGFSSGYDALWSEEITSRLQEVIIPTLDKPTNVTTTATTSSITLKWDEVTNASIYKVCMSETTISDASKCEENGGTLLSGGTSTETTITDNLNADTMYYFRVKGFKDGYESTWSDEKSIQLKELSLVNPGTVQGSVIDAVTNKVLSAKITISQKDGTKLKSILTNIEGKYSESLSEGDYVFLVEATNYISEKINVEIKHNEITVVSSLRQIPNSANGDGIAKGKIIDALNGENIEAVTLKVRKGVDSKEGTVIVTEYSDGDGEFSFDLPAGNYTVEAVADGYISIYFELLVLGKETKLNQNASMTPNIQTGEVRIILSWGDKPGDLDSHLIIPSMEGSSSEYHVYWGMRGLQYSAPYTKLDVDRSDLASSTAGTTLKSGPETITIYESKVGLYHYYVHNFSEDDEIGRRGSIQGSLADSRAIVKIYTSTGLFKSFTVPSNGIGNYWDVFTYDGGTGDITSINRIDILQN